MNDMNRRAFLSAAAGVVAAAAAPALARARLTAPDETPPHLSALRDLYELDPRCAARAWFGRARCGLQVQFGLYSVLGRGEDAMHADRIPVAEYERLAGSFRPLSFNADRITDLALESGAGYVSITARHSDGFALYHSKVSGFTSTKTAAHRDFVAELAHQCHQKGLGLFLSYSYARDWHHPYFYPRQFDPMARPAYERPEASYRWTRDADFGHYLEYAHAQLAELLTHYGPIAGLRLEPAIGYFARPELFPIRETYSMIRRLQPHCLIAFGEGVTGEEDFAVVERGREPLEARVDGRFSDVSLTTMAARARLGNTSKPSEILERLPGAGFGSPQQAGAAVWGLLRESVKKGSNVLLVAGAGAEGELLSADLRTLRELGARIRTEGFPA